jgi:integrase
LRKRFDKLGVDWQIRDLRAKAASDSSTSKDAQALLGHSAATTTDGYIRQHSGAQASPVMRRIAGEQS